LWPLLFIIAGLNDLIRREGVAWPILLIGAGTFFLLNNFDPHPWVSWTQLIQLWPILLIAGGIDLVFKGQSGWVTIFGVLLAVLLIGGALWIASEGIHRTAEYQAISQSYQSEIAEAEVDLSLGFGELILSSTTQKEVLIQGSITLDNKDQQITAVGDRLFYQLENKTPVVFPLTARWELDLTEDLPLTLLVKNGVGEMQLALVNLNLNALDVNQGIGSLVVRIPKNAPDDILIHQSIGIVQVQLPEDVNVALDVKNGLSRVDLPPGFSLRNGYYYSPGASQANLDLSITIEQAIGYVAVQIAR
jgi:hypothetical protein